MQLLLCSQAGPPEAQPLGACLACLWLHHWVDSVCCASPSPMQTCAHTSPRPWWPLEPCGLGAQSAASCPPRPTFRF